ncbi:MAG: hypothetical protein QOH31_3556 [Verrucomicrobiota bacterium]|jgi:hypothetical protein
MLSDLCGELKSAMSRNMILAFRVRASADNADGLRLRA